LLGEQTEAVWIARQSDTTEPVWILEPVDRDYLQGLYDAGCKLRTCSDVPKQSAMDRLRSRVAELIRAA
jgi:hypothetical protein